MAPINIKLTNQQKKDIRDGKNTVVTISPGVQIIVTPWLVAHARAQFEAGQPVVILPEQVGNGMIEVAVT